MSSQRRVLGWRGDHWTSESGNWSVIVSGFTRRCGEEEGRLLPSGHDSTATGLLPGQFDVFWRPNVAVCDAGDATSDERCRKRDGVEVYRMRGRLRKTET